MKSPGVFTTASLNRLLLLATVLQSANWVWAALCHRWSSDQPRSFQFWLCQGHLVHPGAIFTSTRNTEFRLALAPAKEELATPLGM